MHIKCIISVPMLLTIFNLEGFHCSSGLLMWIHSCLYCYKHSGEKCYIHTALHLKGYLPQYHTTKCFVPSHGSALLVQYGMCSLLFSSLCDMQLQPPHRGAVSICCLQQRQAPSASLLICRLLVTLILWPLLPFARLVWHLCRPLAELSLSAIASGKLLACHMSKTSRRCS